VLTDGSLLVGADDAEAKRFHVHDGLGLKLLLEQGIEVALITARESVAVTARARELGIRHVFQGQANKLVCLDALCQTLGLAREQVAYTGDDLPDLAALQSVGLAIAVANAHSWVASHAHWHTRQAGGAGAVREVCDLILQAQDRKAAIVAQHSAR
jgi:3-deoxy-D-manno-octulosonate 8-phosphate phosphatase (KDO 8-P phosphatase)